MERVFSVIDLDSENTHCPTFQLKASEESAKTINIEHYSGYTSLEIIRIHTATKTK